MGLCLAAAGREGGMRGRLGDGIASLLPRRVRPRSPAEPRAGTRRAGLGIQPSARGPAAPSINQGRPGGRWGLAPAFPRHREAPGAAAAPPPSALGCILRGVSAGIGTRREESEKAGAGTGDGGRAVLGWRHGHGLGTPSPSRAASAQGGSVRVSAEQERGDAGSRGSPWSSSDHPKFLPGS